MCFTLQAGHTEGSGVRTSEYLHMDWPPFQYSLLVLLTMAAYQEARHWPLPSTRPPWPVPAEHRLGARPTLDTRGPECYWMPRDGHGETMFHNQLFQSSTTPFFVHVAVMLQFHVQLEYSN